MSIRKGRIGSTGRGYIYVKNQAIGKGIWWMPRQSEAKKDVIHCEKLRGVVNKRRSADIRMGEPTVEIQYLTMNK